MPSPDERFNAVPRAEISNLFNASIRTKIKAYIQREEELKEFLNQQPDAWPDFQKEFDKIIFSICREVMTYEKANRADETKLYKIRRLFSGRLRKYFLHGEYVRHSFEKPFGYPGDFKIIDAIYQNLPQTAGFDRLFDEHFLKMHASVATRNRKEDFKKIIARYVRGKKDRIRIMDLASGPCRDVKELFEENPDFIHRVTVDCCDFDAHALDYGRNLFQGLSCVNFLQKNAIRMALKKDPRQEISQTYDLIFSTGLFDYLDERLAGRLIANLRTLLNPGGLLAISNYCDRYSNPSIYLMEWVAEWNLVYRTCSEFKQLFLDAGFAAAEIEMQFEKQKIMQYCLAHKS